MYCPQCRVEFREGVTKCSDCGIPLVAALPPEPKVESESDTQPDLELEDVAAPIQDMVTILDTGDAIRAAMARGILRDAGIPFYVAGESYEGFNTSWRHQILVEPGREVEARDALQLIENTAS